MKKIIYVSVILLLMATITYAQTVTPEQPFISGTLKGSAIQKYDKDSIYIDLRLWDLANIDSGTVLVGLDSVGKYGPRKSDSLGWAAVKLQVIPINRYPLAGKGYFNRTFNVNDTLISTSARGKVLSESSAVAVWNSSIGYTWYIQWPQWLFIIGYNFADTSGIYKNVETNYNLNFGFK